MTIHRILILRVKRLCRLFAARDVILFYWSKVLYKLGHQNGKEVAIRIKALAAPVICRLGTSDIEVLREIFLEDEYAMLEFIDAKTVKTIIDLGSNIGLSVRFWAQQFPNAKIVGVEPDRDNLTLCKQNCLLGGIMGRVVLLEAGIGANRGVGHLLRDRPSWAFQVVHDATGDGGRIKMLTICDIIKDLSLEEEIDILKCDIEGSESDVMKHCIDWIDRVKIMLIELHAPYSLAQLKSDLQKTGREFSVLKTERGEHLVVVHRLS